MQKALQFLREAYAELIRVNWPTRQTTVQYTILVIAISIIVAVFLGSLDWAFGGLVSRYLLA